MNIDFKTLWAAIETAGFTVGRCALYRVNGSVSGVAESKETIKGKPVLKIWSINGTVSTQAVH